MERLKQVEIRNEKFTLEGKVVEAELIKKPSHFVSIEGDGDGPNQKELIKKCPKKANAYFAKSFMEVWTPISITHTYNVLYLKIK